jgi:hypothetical protein
MSASFVMQRGGTFSETYVSAEVILFPRLSEKFIPAVFAGDVLQ